MEIKKDVTKSKVLYVMIGLLCIALCASLFFALRSPYIKSGSVEHLGRLTYTLPVDTQYASKSEWVYSDFVCDTEGIEFPGKNGSVGVDGNSGKILMKGYVDMSTLTEVNVEYDMGLVELDKSKTVSWDKAYGEVPKCVERVTIETDEGPLDGNAWSSGTYWRAFVTAKGMKYIVNVRSLHDSDLSYIGESIISSMSIDDSLNDEYDK